jgi:hypothetical protein
MNNTTKLTFMTILTAGILISSFMLPNTNPTFAKKTKQCDKTGTLCQTTAKNIKNSSTSGEKGKDGANGASVKGLDGAKGKDGANGITITGKHGSNDSNVVEEQTQLYNSTTTASNVTASTSTIDNSGAANPFGLPM